MNIDNWVDTEIVYHAHKKTEFCGFIKTKQFD